MLIIKYISLQTLFIAFSLLFFKSAKSYVMNMEVVEAEDIYDVHSPWYIIKISKDFISTGNVTEGHLLVDKCHDVLKICAECEDIRMVCRVCSDLYDIAKQWDVCEEKRQIWRKTNRSISIHKLRPIKSEIDDYGLALEEVLRQVGALKDFIRDNNLTVELNKTFVSKIVDVEGSEVYRKYVERQDYYKLLRFHIYFVRTPISAVIFVIGVLGNGVMISILTREREMRTLPNMLLLNLAVVDLFNLIVSLALLRALKIFEVETTRKSNIVACKVIVFLLTLCIGLSIFALMSVSLFRFLAVTRTNQRPNSLISTKYIVIILIVLVWVLSAAVTTPTVLAYQITSEGSCENTTGYKFFWFVWNFFIYCVLPFIIIVVLYILTALRLAQSARNIPGESHGKKLLRKGRNRSAKVLVVLSVIFAVSFIPYNLANTLNLGGVVTLSPIFIDDFFCILYLSSMANPVALIFISKRFRHYFFVYMCRRDRITKYGTLTGSSSK